MCESKFYPGFLWWLFILIFSPLVVVGSVQIVRAALEFYKLYLWLGVGIVVFFIADKFIIRGKDDTIRIFSHELNHAVVSLMLFKKVHSFHVEESGGVVYFTSGRRFSTVLITLAPYCLPLFSYTLLIARSAMLPNLYWIADILTGITVGFYASVFIEQTGPHQLDITHFRHRLFPYLYIFTFILFNMSIIIHSLFPGMNVFIAFADTFVGYWHTAVNFVRILT